LVQMGNLEKFREITAEKWVMEMALEEVTSTDKVSLGVSRIKSYQLCGIPLHTGRIKHEKIG
jgi:hypothetical protein